MYAVQVNGSVFAEEKVQFYLKNMLFTTCILVKVDC